MRAQGRGGPSVFQNRRALERVNLCMADSTSVRLKPNRFLDWYRSLGEILEYMPPCLAWEVHRE